MDIFSSLTRLLCIWTENPFLLFCFSFLFGTALIPLQFRLVLVLLLSTSKDP
jgi:hypothetical protein